MSDEQDWQKLTGEVKEKEGWRKVLRLPDEGEIPEKEIDRAYFTLKNDLELKINQIEEKIFRTRKIGGVVDIIDKWEKIREIAKEYGDGDMMDDLDFILWYLKILEMKEQLFDVMEARMFGKLDYLGKLTPEDVVKKIKYVRAAKY